MNYLNGWHLGVVSTVVNHKNVFQGRWDTYFSKFSGLVDGLFTLEFIQACRAAFYLLGRAFRIIGLTFEDFHGRLVRCALVFFL